MPVLLSLFLLVFFLSLLILPLLLLFFFSFSLFLQSLHHHCTLPSQITIQNLITQINGKVGFFTLYPPKAEAWQTGAVPRRHLAGRLRPVPAYLSGPQPPSATLSALSPAPLPTLLLQYMLPGTTSNVASQPAPLKFCEMSTINNSLHKHYRNKKWQHIFFTWSLKPCQADQPIPLTN